MAPSGAPGQDRRLSALPSRRARALAFASILLAGVCGALIGSAFVELQCEQDCTTAAGVGSLIGALAGAGGVAVVAVLVLRAMGEWQRIAAERSGQDEGPSPPSVDQP